MKKNRSSNRYSFLASGIKERIEISGVMLKLLLFHKFEQTLANTFGYLKVKIKKLIQLTTYCQTGIKSGKNCKSLGKVKKSFM